MTIRSLIFSIVTLILTISLSSCQEEIIDILEPAEEDVVTSNSAIADLINRTTLLDGSYDNIIDSASCFTIVLPVTVIANGLELTIDSASDFSLLEKIFDQFDDDDDLIEYFFPITVITADYGEITLNDMSELNELRSGCEEGGIDDDIECVDFKFPLTFTSYDSVNQVSNAISVENDSELHEFIDDLDDDDIISLVFPVTVIYADGQEVTVTSNAELEDALEAAIDLCDEDDDFDFDEDDVSDSVFVSILVDGSWKITYYFDDQDETDDFKSYEFMFLRDGSVKVLKGDSLITGVWYAYGDDGILEFELDFGSTWPLKELNDDWVVIEFDESRIKLGDESGDSTEEYVTFEKVNDHSGGGDDNVDPGDGGDGNTDPVDSTAAFSAILVNGTWSVVSYQDDAEDKTDDFTGFVLDFIEDGSVKASNGNTEITGSWEEIKDGEVRKLVLDFGETMPFDEFTEDWVILEFSESKIKLENISGGDGSKSELILEKN